MPQEENNNDSAYSLPLINQNSQKENNAVLKNKANFGRNTFYIPKQQGLLEIFPVGDAEGSSVIAGQLQRPGNFQPEGRRRSNHQAD